MENIISVRSLSVGFPVRTGFLNRETRYRTVLDGVSIDIKRGRTVGLVGESGSGKTTLGRAILKLIPFQNGEILYHREDRIVPIHELAEREFRKYRKELQIVFQDPYSSLNPKLKVEEILTEALLPHFPHESRDQRVVRCRRALDRVGLSEKILDRYAHEFSGGQRQRISIARAIILEPSFIVLDECVSALDVSIQAQIMNLLLEIQRELSIAYLFISHDIAVVRHLSHEIAVIDNGSIVEYGPSDAVTRSPEHDYTKQLLSAIPSLVPRAL